MDPIKIVSEMVGVRQDIQELSRRVEEKTMKMDRLIDELVEWMKHKRIIEPRKVR
jgi:cell division protein FtsL